MPTRHAGRRHQRAHSIQQGYGSDHVPYRFAREVLWERPCNERVGRYHIVRDQLEQERRDQHHGARNRRKRCTRGRSRGHQQPGAPQRLKRDRDRQPACDRAGGRLHHQSVPPGWALLHTRNVQRLARLDRAGAAHVPPLRRLRQPDRVPDVQLRAYRAHHGRDPGERRRAPRRTPGGGQRGRPHCRDRAPTNCRPYGLWGPSRPQPTATATRTPSPR